MLKRTSITYVNSILEKEPGWKILDVGCGYRANKNASVIADVQDFSNFYKGKNFVQLQGKNLPFKDKEFNFVIASHVIEHVNDFEFFIKELERVSSKGYIELPSRLADNLVFENKKDHIWWFCFDDVNNKLIASKKNQIINPLITVSIAKLLEEIFRESFVIEIAWENKIEYKIDDVLRQENYEKISLFKLFRKFISKKLRSLYR